MSCKKRASENYLIISSCYLGVSKKIVKVYAQVAKKYKAKVIHLGRTVPQKELNLYLRSMKQIQKLEESLDTVSTPAAVTNIENRIQGLVDQCKFIEDDEHERMRTITDAFGNDVLFITNDTQSIMAGKDDFDVSDKNYKLGKYLTLSPFNPTGERTILTQFNKNSINYFRNSGKNWITPHPVPSICPMPRPGLNEVYNYFTVGCLIERHNPAQVSEIYKNSHMPCALFVSLDPNTEEFHPRRIDIDYDDEDYYTQNNPFSLDDGLLFTQDKCTELTSKDKMTGSTDDHAPYQHPGTLGALRALNSLHNPETFVNLGDAADFDPINPHARGPGDTEGLRLIDTFNSLKALLTAQSEHKTIKNKILIDSNHHNWLTSFIKKNPSLEGILDLRTIASKYYKDWTFLYNDAGENEIYYFGDYALRHGHQESGVVNGESKFQKGKYICGHWHSLKSYRRAYQCGAGTMLGPSYLNGRITAWQNQVMSATKYKDITSINPKLILHDKTQEVSRFCYRGSIYEASFYHADHSFYKKKIKGKFNKSS